MKDTITVQPRWVFPTPSTNVCSNINSILSWTDQIGMACAAPRNFPLLLHRLRRLTRRLRPFGRYRRLGYRRRRSRRTSPATAFREVTPEYHNRTGDEHRRISPDNYTYHQCKRKPVQYRSPEQEQRYYRQERQPRGHDRPAQRLVDASIDQRLQRLPARQLQVLPDPVEDNDSIIHRVPDQSQERRDHREVDFLLEQREQPDRDDRVMKNRDHGCHSINPLEPEGDVDQHPG